MAGRAMTTTISAQHAITTVHEAVLLGGNDGQAVASIAAMVSFTECATERYLLDAAARGLVSRMDGRWVAWDVCRTCGYGERDRHYPTYHPSPAACETHPVDYAAGYPL